MSDERRLLKDGGPVKDRSHTEIDPATGMQKDYIVLSEEERAKGFVKPVRRSYIHEPCGTLTKMGVALSETYARDPRFYSGTFCVGCKTHYPLNQFHWEDGEPMDPDLQSGDWLQKKAFKEANERLQRTEQRVRRALSELDQAQRDHEAAQIEISKLETPPEAQS